MLLVVRKGHEDDIKVIFEKWDLHAEIIGEVIDEDRLLISYHGELKADVPPESLVLGGGAPVYTRDKREPEYLKKTRGFSPDSLPAPRNLSNVLLTLMAAPNVASKRWVYHQYDSMVRTNNMLLADADAAVIFLKETGTALSVKTDCNGRYVYLNPRRGAQIAVAESARNVACTGAVPVAITNCLNFGNPYKPEVYWQFAEAIAGMGEACRVFDTPVTGGNVSFYNESPTAAVYPTPVIGMLGVIDDVRCVTRSGFSAPGDAVILLGRTAGHIGGSEYLHAVHGLVAGDAPAIDLVEEKRLQGTLLEAIRAGFVRSAHDCSDGGLAVALAECCLGANGVRIGATISLEPAGLRPDFYLFGEDQSRVVISAAPDKAESVIALCAKNGIPAKRIGTVGGERLVVGDLIDVGCGDLAEAYYTSIENRMA
jgi:phosphoribosylformylglycinamidine synthase